MNNMQIVGTALLIAGVMMIIAGLLMPFFVIPASVIGQFGVSYYLAVLQEIDGMLLIAIGVVLLSVGLFVIWASKHQG